MVILDRYDFQNDQAIIDFSDFIIEISQNFTFHLNMKRSAKVPGGINVRTAGFSGVLSFYKWNSSCFDICGNQLFSENWSETRALLSTLSSNLKTSVDNDDGSSAKKACFNILKWGGDRNSRVGASQDINSLHSENSLVPYLKKSKGILSQDAISSNDLSCIPYTGSMWTKIYALNSDDSLPIYDSRVAMALVGMKYLFQKSNNTKSIKNDHLNFRIPIGTNWARNQTSGLDFQTVSKISKNNPIWSVDTLKLSWLADLVLSRSRLFEEQGTLNARKHALEATLFMLGYDLKAMINGSKAA